MAAFIKPPCRYKHGRAAICEGVCAIVLCHQSGSLIWAKALHALHKPHGWAPPPLNDAVMELRSGFMTPFAVLLSLDSASQVLIIPSGMQH